MEIKKMNAEQFANRLIELRDGETIEFACSCNEPEIPVEELSPYDVEDWYFARIINIHEYESRFILIDYCGGEEAYAIPLNSYSEEADEDDKGIIKHMIAEYFKKYNRFLNSVDDFVYVENKEN